jgi:hypothetical protein
VTRSCKKSKNPEKGTRVLQELIKKISDIQDNTYIESMKITQMKGWKIKNGKMEQYAPFCHSCDLRLCVYFFTTTFLTT